MAKLVVILLLAEAFPGKQVDGATDCEVSIAGFQTAAGV